MKQRFLFFFCVTSLVLSSCKITDDFDNLSDNYKPEIAAPLLTAKTNFQKLIGNKTEAIKIDPDGNMRLYYKGTVSEKKATDALNIFSSNGILVPFQDTITTYNFKSDLDIYKIFLNKKTNMTMGFVVPAGTPNSKLEGKIIIPNLTKNGIPFEFPFSKDVKGGEVVSLPPVSLNGYVLTFEQKPTLKNILTFKYVAKIDNGAKNLSLSCLINIRDITLDLMEAYMDKKQILLDPGKVDLDFYDEQEQGSIKFDDPRITVLVENSYGFPMRTQINYITSVSINKDSILLNASGLTDKGFDFPYPKYIAGEIGQTKKFSYDFTKKTSNIKDILDSKPKSFYYDIDVIANPNSEQGIGFITDSTNLKIGIEVDIPLIATAKDFVVKQDYDDINFESVLENISEAELRLIADNAIPAEVSGIIDFLDKDGKLLTQTAAAPQVFVKGAPIDASGNAIGISRNELVIVFDKNKTDLLRQCKKIQVRFYFSTSNNGSTTVNIKGNQDINLRMGVKAKTQF